MKKNNWEEEFDKLFLDGRYGNRLMIRKLEKGYTQTARTKDVKDFIHQTIAEEKTKLVEEIREWVNRFDTFHEGAGSSLVFRTSFLNIWNPTLRKT
ncbi:MAG: hypothetical protein AABY22_20310 [Nanoarchaeota archaeon]